MRLILSALCIVGTLSTLYAPSAGAAVMTSEKMNGVPVTVWKSSSKATAFRNMPVIIFSHGFSGCSTQSEFLTAAMADRGYLVIAPDHEDARCGELYKAKNNGFFAGLKEMFSSDVKDTGRHFHGKPTKPFDIPQDWDDTTESNRITDIKTVIDFITADRKYRGMIDADNIGVTGHSLGGYTAMAVSGAWKSRKDTRIRAVVAFAPYIAPFTVKKSLSDIKIPVMIQSATDDKFAAAFPGAFDTAYDMLNIQKYHAVLDGADHFAWTDGVKDYQRVITAYTVSFFDHYLRGSNTPLLFNKKVVGLAEYRSNMIRNTVPRAKKINSLSGR